VLGVHWLLVVVTVAGGVIRLVGIGAQSLWYDEVVTREVITGPIVHLLSRVRLVEGTPPLYFGLLAVWSRIVGDGDGEIRLFSAIVGTAAIPVLYAACRELRLSRRTSLIAAALLAVNPYLVWYSQEARAYSLLVLLAAVSVLAFARALQRGRSRDYWLFGLATAALLATHYFAIFLIAPELAMLLWQRRHSWRPVVLGLVPLALAAVPLSWLAIDQRSRNLQEWIHDWSLRFRLGEAARHLLAGPSAPRPWLWKVLGAAVALGALVALLAPPRQERTTARMMTTIGLTAVLLPIVLALLGADYFLDRNVIVVVVVLVIPVAIGFGSTRFRFVGSTVLVAVLVGSVVTTTAVVRDVDLQRANFRTIAEVIHRTDRQQVVVMNTARVLGSSLRRYLPSPQELQPGASVKTRDVTFIGLNRVPGQCDWWFGRACSIVFLTASPLGRFPTGFRLVSRTAVDRFVVAHYRYRRTVDLRAQNLVTAHDLPASLIFVLPAGAP
jgi:uncharacterized membrane protein